MWVCHKCNRNFKSTNQSHSYVSLTIDDLLVGKPVDLVLTFDQILIGVIEWEPCTVGTSKNAIIFTNKKAWLIVKPLAKELDLKFYYHERIQHPLIKKVNNFYGKFAHHIRVTNPDQITNELIILLRKGYKFALK
jgi:hypothetical protein